VSAAKAALQTCAASGSPRPANCPQYLFAFFLGGSQNVHWMLTNDPAAGATVRFDPATGIYTVQGTYAMDVTYDSGGQQQTSQDHGSYTAQLLWDGTHFVLATLQR
jgi:hypothetical protein